jgi:hypothetical protein
LTFFRLPVINHMSTHLFLLANDILAHFSLLIAMLGQHQPPGNE